MSDLIKREHLIKILEDAKRSAYEHWDIDTGNAFEEGINLVKNIPIIEAEPIKHGRWIKSEKSDYHWECSNCGYGLTDYRTTYCYDCGARMDEVEE